MLSKPNRLPLVVLLVIACSFARAEPINRLRIATWNVENLFDAEDDPDNKGDDEFLPTSWRRWTEARYAQKLTNLAYVISSMKPDAIGLQEVENRRVLTDLAAVLAEPPFDWPLPNISHWNSPDPRGIDVGLITRLPVKQSRLVTEVPYLRGALVSTLDAGGSDLTIIVCHWKSWLGDAELNTITRLREALAVRSVVDSILSADPHASVIVSGDLNDNLDGHSLQQGLMAYADRQMVADDSQGSRLYNVLGELPKSELGSYYYARRKVWNTFDTLIITPAMLLPRTQPGPDWRLTKTSANRVRVFKLPEMMENDGRPKAFRRVRLKDGTDSYAQGYSDHFPIVMELIRYK
jgi:endonuclease/exonuclease/phosphatase family metal-dependent hydrolase